MPDALHEEAPLQPKGSQEQVDTHTAEPISLEEGHKEPEANEDHDVDILKHWKHGKRGLDNRPLLCFESLTLAWAKCGHEIESD